MQVLPCDSEHLPLSYQLCTFDPLNYSPCGRCRPRSLHGTQPAIDVAVIGFDTVIAVAARSLTASLRHTPFGLELTNGRWVTPQSVSRENVRWWVVGVRQYFLQEQLGGLAVARLGEVEVDRLAMAIHRTE
jgi:hypothetical protein